MRKVYGYIEEYLPSVIFVVIAAVMILQVLLRLIFGFSLPWTVELSMFLNVWLTFVGIAYIRRINSHIKIEMFFAYINERLPKWGQIALYVFKKLMNVSLMILLVRFGYELASRTSNLVSPAMQISMFWWYICVSLGSLGYLFREVQDIVLLARKKDIKAVEGGAE